jgi:hypothetical protein
MPKTRFREALVALAALTMLTLAACGAGPQEMGTLEGHVSMSMSPVLQEGVPEPTPAPEAYAVRQIVIFSQDGRREVARVQIGPRSNYRVDLPAGSYVVDINHVGMDQGIDLPRTVEIRSGHATRLDVRIDTGIR